MVTSDMTTKPTRERTSIVVRGLTPDDIAVMKSLALANNRSLDGEYRHAIQAYLAPHRLQTEFAEQRTALAQRLHFAHATFLENNPEHSPKLSYLAEAVGEERAGPLESWFNGAPGAPFKLLEKLAAYLGCSSDWLIHG